LDPTIDRTFDIMNEIAPFVRLENDADGSRVVLADKVAIDSRTAMYPLSGNNKSLGADEDGKQWNSLYLKNFSVDEDGVLTSSGPALFKNDVDIEKNVRIDDQLTVDKSAFFGGDRVVLGDEADDTIYVNGRIGTNLIPLENNQFNLGSFERQWKDLRSSGTIYTNNDPSGKITYSFTTSTDSYRISGFGLSNTSEIVSLENI